MRRSSSRASTLWAGGLCLVALAVCLAPSRLAGQGAVQAPAPVQAPPQPGAPVASVPVKKVNLLAGRSTVVVADFDVIRIAVTDTEVADAIPVKPREILINGKKPGTISLITWGATERAEYELVVDPPIATLQQQIQTFFPGEDIRVSLTGGAIVLNGRASTNDVMLRVGEIAAASAPNAKVINMLALPGGAVSQQVMLQVRFAEVNHKAVEELGVNLFVNRANIAGRSTTQQFSAPNFDDQNNGGGLGGLTFSDFLNIFFFQRNQGVGAVLKALQQSGTFESLAEPNLIAYNGQEASFLAGGEVPVPIVSGLNNAVSVTYKEFGVRLTFKPTIAGDVIRLHVRPEVSALDFANGVTLAGFRIPALTTRYAETEVELRDGQSFAIAGLLDNVAQDDKAAIPFLSKIPIIGVLFKSKSTRKEQTELLVLITPRLVRPLNPDEVPPLPTVKPPAGRGGGGGDVGSQLKGGGGIVDAPASGGRGGDR